MYMCSNNFQCFFLAEAKPVQESVPSPVTEATAAEEDKMDEER